MSIAYNTIYNAILIDLAKKSKKSVEKLSKNQINVARRLAAGKMSDMVVHDDEIDYEVKVNKNQPSRKQLASQVFAALYGKVARKIIIQKMIDEIGMTKNGAATYYQNFKSGQWDY